MKDKRFFAERNIIMAYQGKRAITPEKKKKETYH